MALPRQLTQISFAAGLDESTEDEVLDPSAGFPVLQNVRQDRRGGVSKRLGYGSVVSTRTNGTSRTEGRRLFAHKGVPCVISDDGLDLYSEALDKNIAVAGNVPRCTAMVTTLPASVSVEAGAHYDVAICNGFLILVYANATSTEAAGANVLVTTADDFLPVRTDTQLFGVADPIFQVGSYGTTAIIIAGATSSANLNLWKLDCTSTTTIASGWTLVGSVAASKSTSSSVLSLQSLTDRVAFAYITGVGAAQVVIVSANATGALGSVSVNTSSVTPDNLTLEGSTADTLWIAWNENLDIKVKGYDAATLTTKATTATVITGTGIRVDRPPAIVSSAMTGAASLIVSPSPSGRVMTASWTTSAGAVVPGASSEMHGAELASRAWSHDGKRYALFSTSDSFDTGYGADTIALADWTSFPFPPVALARPGLASVDPAAHSLTLPDGRIAYIIAVLSAASVKSYALVACDFADRFRLRSAAHNGVTFLSGAVLSYLSTDRVQECSFLHPPQHLDVTPDGGGTGPLGEVHYVAQFESVDGAGNLSLSGVSDPFAYTGTGVQVFPQCDPILLTSRGDVRVTLYRTTTNGKIYYKVETRNARSTDVITFVDSKTDASLESQPLLGGTGVLPGTGGAPLQREAPPYCSDVVSFNGMLVIATGSDLWWSGQTIGGEGTWFSAEQFFVTVDGDDDITALAVQDGTLYVFKERAIWAVAGEAPADNGSSGGLGTPRRLAGDVGCTEPSSVVVTSFGIFFRSHRGIELLSRGGSPSWIGEKVQNTLAAYPYVTSATLDVRNNVVRFSLASGITSGVVSGDGRDIVFDLTLEMWQSVDDKHGSSDHQASQDACVVDYDGASRYAWLGANGTLYVESDDYLDNGSTWITMAAETGWFKVAGIQGKQQINQLLTLLRTHTGCDLSVALGYDYNETYDTAREWTRAEIDTVLTKLPITRLRHDPSDDSDGIAVRVRMSDAAPSSGSISTGRGATWLALTLDITPKDGPAEVPEEAA